MLTYQYTCIVVSCWHTNIYVSLWATDLYVCIVVSAAVVNNYLLCPSTNSHYSPNMGEIHSHSEQRAYSQIFTATGWVNLCIELFCWMMIQNRMSPGWLTTHEKTLLIITFDAQLVCFALMFSTRISFLQNVVFPARQHLDLFICCSFQHFFQCFCSEIACAASGLHALAVLWQNRIV